MSVKFQPAFARLGGKLKMDLAAPESGHQWKLFYQKQLYSEENLGVGLGIPIDLSVKVLPYFCFMNFTSLGIMFFKILLYRKASQDSNGQRAELKPSVDKIQATVISPRVEKPEITT